MKLQDTFEGTVYATRHRTVFRAPDGKEFERVGRLPVPAAGDAGATLRSHATTTGALRAPLEQLVGRFPTVNLWALTEADLVATVGRWLCSSHDGGERWTARRRLPPSAGTMGVLPSALDYADGTVRLGEYRTGSDGPPRILRSPDRGRSWTVEAELPGVRHVHAVATDPYDGAVWVTTGDADEECHVGRLRGGEFVPVGGGSQQWRAVEPAFTPTAVLWGVDCAYADRNAVYRLDRAALEDARPTPERVHDVPASVYYGATVTVEGTTWAAFSTAAETGRDSTAPDRTLRGTGRTAVVAAASDSDYREWVELASHPRRRCVADLLDGVVDLPTANAYTFLAADPAHGLFLNPYNAGAGTDIALVPRARFAAMGAQPR
jgi:hypothetical protein